MNVQIKKKGKNNKLRTKEGKEERKNYKEM